MITAFVRPNRSTCFVRCADCIGSKFAKVVLSVYREAVRVPADPQMNCAEIERVRTLLRVAEETKECVPVPWAREER